MVTFFLAILIVLLFNISPIVLLTYLIIIVYRSLKNPGSTLDNFLYYLIRDIQVMIGLILFFPKKPKNIDYIVIK